ncbi:auxin-responsive protein IAA21-like isoform X2 [Curcuma longa]|uniref:auxin-responsive protein IAA21-like isoform X2 n=1 Tax=Curcuma longa TaxID=136217 RepID=UPI003D9DD82F
MTPPMEHDYMGVNDTELRLGLPGSNGRVADGGATGGLTLGCAKRGFSDVIHGGSFSEAGEDAGGVTKAAPPPPPAKTQIVGWPPIRSYRKNTIASNSSKNNNDDADAKQGNECHYVKVSMDGAPYLRKVNLNRYSDYKELSLALEKMFTCVTFGSYGVSAREMTTEGRVLDLLQGSEHALTYEDKDGDWMLVGDVPWPMFADSCRRLRIMKGSDAIGIAPKAMEKSRIRN